MSARSERATYDKMVEECVAVIKQCVRWEIEAGRDGSSCDSEALVTETENQVYGRYGRIVMNFTKNPDHCEEIYGPAEQYDYEGRFGANADTHPLWKVASCALCADAWDAYDHEAYLKELKVAELRGTVCMRCDVVLDTDEGLQTGICASCWKPETDMELFS